MGTIFFYSEHNDRLNNVATKTTPVLSFEANGRRYVVLPTDDKFSLLRDDVVVGTFSVESGKTHETFQERKITFSSPNVRPFISNIIDLIRSPTSYETAASSQEENKIEEGYIFSPPIEEQNKIVHQEESVKMNATSSSTPLTFDQLKIAIENSTDLMIEVVYDEKSYQVCAKKLLEAGFFIGLASENYKNRCSLASISHGKSTSYKLQFSEKRETDEDHDYLPVFLLSLQAQHTDFEKWALSDLLFGYLASDQYCHEEMKEAFFKAIVYKEINIEQDLTAFSQIYTIFQPHEKIMLELIKKHDRFLQFAILSSENNIFIKIFIDAKKFILNNNTEFNLSYFTDNLISYFRCFKNYDKKLIEDIQANPAIEAAIKENPALMFKIVTRIGHALQFASPELQNDPTIVLAAVNQDGLALQFASPELQNDPTIVLAAVNQKGLALQFASSELQNDREIVLPAVLQNGLALQFASPELQNDREIVLAAINQNDLALQFVSPELQNDPEIHRAIILAAINQNALALQVANSQLENNREIVGAAINRNQNIL